MTVAGLTISKVDRHPGLRQDHPERSLRVPDLWARVTPSVGGQLLSEGQVLQHESRPRPQPSTQNPDQDREQKPNHRPTVAHPEIERFQAGMGFCGLRLVENAIKYGESVPAAGDIRFSLWETDGVLHIQTVNGCTDEAGVRDLMSRVEEVATAPDPAGLYVARVQVLLEHPHESGKLGVYRIALEGGFTLQCEYQQRVVTMTATRKIS
jgi:hypothetical protein